MKIVVDVYSNVHYTSYINNARRVDFESYRVVTLQHQSDFRKFRRDTMSRSFKTNGKHISESGEFLLKRRGKGKGSQKLVQVKLRDEKHGITTVDFEEPKTKTNYRDIEDNDYAYMM